MAPTRPEGSPLVVKELGGFQLLRELGQGGMGKVFLARQPSLDRQVALKVLQPQLAQDAQFVVRFLTEAKVAAQFQHPHVVQVYDLGKDEASGLHYIAFELLSGGSVEQLLRAKGALPELEALRIAHAVAQALTFAESKGLVHRDIKPENILLSSDGVPKLADLGLVKDLAGGGTAVTQTGVVLGTPHYMAPEQAMGDRPLDVRSDIYALGLCLWRCLTGLVPYDEERTASVLHILNRHIHTDLPDVRQRAPHVSAATAALVARMAAREPDQRPRSAVELVEALAARIRELSGASGSGPVVAPPAPRPPGKGGSAGLQLPVPAVPPTAPASAPGQAGDEPSSRGPVLVLGAVLVLTTALLGVGLRLAFRDRRPPAPPAPPATASPAPAPPARPPLPPGEAAPPGTARPAEVARAPDPPPEPPPPPEPAPASPTPEPAPVESPPPPAPAAPPAADLAWHRFVSCSGGLRPALRKDLAEVARLREELDQLHAEHGAAWPIESRREAQALLRCLAGLFKGLSPGGTKQDLYDGLPDGLRDPAQVELHFHELLTRLEDEAPRRPLSAVVAELLITGAVVQILRKDPDRLTGPDLGSLTRTLREPGSPVARAIEAITRCTLLHGWPLLEPEKRVAQLHELMQFLAALSPSLLGRLLDGERQALETLARSMGEDPTSHSRGWFVAARRLEPREWEPITGRIRPLGAEPARAVFLSRVEGKEPRVKLRLEPAVPAAREQRGKRLALELELTARELRLEGETRWTRGKEGGTWTAAVLELDPRAACWRVFLLGEDLAPLAALQVPLPVAPLPPRLEAKRIFPLDLRAEVPASAGVELTCLVPGPK